VTFHRADRLDRIERHLRALARRFKAPAVPPLKPLSREWLADLVAFAQSEPEPPEDYG